MTSAPVRIQRKRTKGWRMPENTVYVGRGSPLGNPAIIGQWSDDPDIGLVENATHAVTIFRDGVECGVEGFPDILRIQQELRGKNLACWCPVECQLCDGKGEAYCLPPGKNAFEMSAETIATSAVKKHCFTCKELGSNPAMPTCS